MYVGINIYHGTTTHGLCEQHGIIGIIIMIIMMIDVTYGRDLTESSHTVFDTNYIGFRFGTTSWYRPRCVRF